MNLYISYTLGPQLRNLNTYFALGYCLFRPIKLAKDADLDKYQYTGYSIGFDSCSQFSFTDRSCVKNVIIIGANMTSFAHVKY